MSGSAAVFLDRDGTLIEDSGYPSDPGRVRLISGAAEAVARLNRAGRPVVVVTNQSGIARGLLTEMDYRATQTRLDQLLAAEGARIDGHYHCPHHPDVTGPCDCRKPGVLLYRRAAEHLGIELRASWWVGDRMRDVSPARELGGRAILVLTGAGADEAARAHANDIPVVADLTAAVERLLSPAMTMRVAVAASGRGSNLEALLRALGPGAPARVVLVLSDRHDAGALRRAADHGVAGEMLADPADGSEWLERLERHRADLVVLAGYVKLVPSSVVARYRGRIINIHPALLPRFGGPGMYGHRVHEAVLASGARESGVTVHLVEEEYDRGEVLAQVRVPVEPGDTPERLARRVLEVEHRLLPAVVLAAAGAGGPVPLPQPLESHS